MFFLKTPHNSGQAASDGMETRGEFRTLDEAIEAAIEADFDLAFAIIEKNGGRHTVNDWISFRIAGGGATAG